MHDIKHFKATPGLARRLLMFSQMNHMIFNEELVELAMSGLLGPKELEGLPFKLDQVQLSSLQYIRDWNSRGMILCSKPERGREVALANSWIEGGPLLIMAQPKFYAQWAQLVRDVYPDAKISVFGNPRYHEKELVFPEGVEFSEKPDFEADVFISSYGGLIWHDFLKQKTVNSTIVEELDHAGAINYKWDGAVKGMFHEIPKPVFIQNINSLPNDHGKDITTCLQSNGSKALTFIREQVTDLLWGGLTNMGVLMYSQAKDAEDYLVARGYTGLDNIKLLAMFGVSTHLLDDAQGHKAPIVFKDNTVKFLNQNKRKESGLHRLIERERAIEAETGSKLSSVVADALSGDGPSQALIGGLMGSQWANLKGQHLKHIHTNLANRLSRCVFLTEHKDLKRVLSLQFGLQMEDLSQSRDRQFTVARYLYPHLPTMLTPLQLRGLRPLSNLIVTIDDLIAEPNILQISNFLFIGELPLDPDYMEAVKEAAAASGTRLVTSVITDLFEEEIHRQLR
jgi:hypothetical protein